MPFSDHNNKGLPTHFPAVVLPWLCAKGTTRILASKDIMAHQSESCSQHKICKSGRKLESEENFKNLRLVVAFRTKNCMYGMLKNGNTSEMAQLSKKKCNNCR